MRKITALLLCALMLLGALAACGENPGTIPAPSVSVPPSESAAPETPESPAASQAPDKSQASGNLAPESASPAQDAAAEASPEESAPSAESDSPSPAEPAKAESAEWEMVRDDRSLTDADGNVILHLYRDRPVLKGDSGAVKAINDYLEQANEAFFDDDFESYVEGTTASAEHPYYNTSDGYVTHNADGVLSVSNWQAWSMGGVFNLIPTGYNFDLNTGKLLTISDLVSAEEDMLIAYLRGVIHHYMTDIGLPMDTYAHERLNSYTVADLGFRVDPDGGITLLIPVYELGPGAAGSMEIPTGLSLGQSQYGYMGETGIYRSFEALTYDDSAVGLEFILHLDRSSFMLTPGYVNSELLEGYAGTCSVENGVLTMDCPELDAHYEYRIAVFGEALQLIQLSEQGIRNGRGPGAEMTFFFYEALTDGQ